MSVELNHTIVWCHDKEKSSRFLVDMLALPDPIPFGPMLVVKMSNGVSLDYYENEEVTLQHYAFLVSEAEFDAVLARIHHKGLDYWADPGKQQPRETYRHNGGRGLYFDDPDGHKLEVLTQPYAIGG